jgi:hypothetical protein
MSTFRIYHFLNSNSRIERICDLKKKKTFFLVSFVLYQTVNRDGRKQKTRSPGKVFFFLNSIKYNIHVTFAHKCEQKVK